MRLLLAPLLLAPVIALAQATLPTPPAAPAAPRATQPPAQSRPAAQQPAPRPRPTPPAATPAPAPAQRAAPAPQAAPAPPPPPPPPPNPPERDNPARGPVTGLPLPRFAATRSEEINLRNGPGLRYQVEWVLTRKDMPVEIIRENDVWRRVRDADGTEGWVQTGTLSGRRVFVVIRQAATLRRRAADDAEVVARLAVGVMGRIRACAQDSAWCEVQSGNFRGFLPRSAFWGTYRNEPVN
jgi:SH3-like domain-containing protein